MVVAVVVVVSAMVVNTIPPCARVVVIAKLLPEPTGLDVEGCWDGEDDLDHGVVRIGVCRLPTGVTVSRSINKRMDNFVSGIFFHFHHVITHDRI